MKRETETITLPLFLIFMQVVVYLQFRAKMPNENYRLQAKKLCYIELIGYISFVAVYALFNDLYPNFHEREVLTQVRAEEA